MVLFPTWDIASAEQVKQPLWHAYAVEFLGETSQTSATFMGCRAVCGSLDGKDFV